MVKKIRKIERRRFGGKGFSHVLTTTSKARAKERAKKDRERGFYVRVVELYPGEYSVYIRSKRRS